MSFTYHSIHGDDGDLEKEPKVLTRSVGIMSTPGSCIALVLAIAALTATAAAGFLAGRLYSVTHETRSFQKSGNWPEPIVELKTIPLTIISNKTYLEKPSLENDKIWDSLYPEDHHGVFRWPDESPSRAGFAGFHQIHCVDTLRRGFYQEQEVIDTLLRGEDISNISRDIKMVHVLHCVEVLRNSVICHADNTLQVEASYLHGIPAFGTTSECKDWFQMVDWVNERNKKFPL